ncbi:hypothetical protein JHL18_21450 [Clostridium sp. YIM B02505]|uniref:Uncharacterized protein n=1 Tax=Clostridium yunnanense TaxID=2800325 RepID=A0ABS1EUX5_9CLOT|nr:hypothetical protein [Clostridium yunnanense]MBK1813192.1 hypothetical protein [Clostridium yunnanense]
MKITNYKLMITAFIFSTVINILFLMNIAPEGLFRISFIIVMVCSLIKIFHNIWIYNKNKKTANDSHMNQALVNINPLYKYLYILLMVFWIITYFAAIFRL